ncbi:MAG: aminodeoxychorismate synthase component I [Epsilonproteobacteria bacterium]|nr:aminodeoxychorismate synthase component I [Campylobacterota bacterium]MBD3839562.1 aminodeoxychorismate synthase component I [Campylobacterota bacterium]
MSEIDALAKDKVPFLFIISYDKSESFIQRLDSLDSDVLFKIGSLQNYEDELLDKAYFLKKNPLSFDEYKTKFDGVIEEIKAGNSYLLNLTTPTPIETNLSLKEIFLTSKAPYKLYFKDKFISFSPEKFITIEEDIISTYPMKGTIDASLKEAKEKILADEKEMAEHIMIVDLMRNDLGKVAKNVKVDSFRYVDRIKAGDKELLQVSSKISAVLASDWHENLSRLLNDILPAGSISGTPKKSTVEIIEKIEGYNRGFYTGIFGIYDGKNLYSAVMIRFVEQVNGGLVYKSGGGITLDSDDVSEYQEVIDKVYLPL